MPQGRVPDRRKSVVRSLLRVLQRRSKIFSLLLRHEKGLQHGIEKGHRGGPGETHPKTQAAPSGNGGSATHYGLPALPEPFLRACGLYRVCTGFAQGTKKSKQQSNSPCCQLHLQRLYVYGAHVLTVPNHLYLTSATDGHVVNSVNSMNLGMMSSSVFVK